MKKSKDFRVRMTTRDGVLVQNREADIEVFYGIDGDKRRPSIVFIETVLNRDACEKGVRVVSYTYDCDTGIDAVVEWLR